MKRILLVLAVAAVMAAMMVAVAAPAFADKGGIPNKNACHGQFISTVAQLGFPPPIAAEETGSENAGEFNKRVKGGGIEFGTLRCPPN
jgi:hypothetical protein